MLVVFVGLVFYLGTARSALPQTTSPLDSAVANDVSAIVSEQSFWSAAPLTTSELRLIVFHDAEAAQLEKKPSFDVLAILPELNSLFEYRVSGNDLILAGREEGWQTWPYPGGGKVDADKYLAQQLSRFADFVSHAKRGEQTARIDTSPTTIFHIDAQLKAARLAQIEHAAKELFKKRPLRLIIANFSSRTDQICAVIPTLDQMVTFSVARSPNNETTVEVGRETPLKSIRAELRQRIETNSSVLVIR